ncbi:MAG: hypothetical protein U0350_35945 [Caldilineaceae bacterium]
MSIEVTLTLPNGVVEHAQSFGRATQRSVEEVLVDALEILWPTLEDLPVHDLYPNVTSLTNEEVIALAKLKMNKSQNRRLIHLQTKGKETGLTEAERFELLALLQIYQLGQLRKSEALAEAVRRGLREPLKP